MGGGGRMLPATPFLPLQTITSLNCKRKTFKYTYLVRQRPRQQSVYLHQYLSSESTSDVWLISFEK
jgi:hypothetical protein